MVQHTLDQHTSCTYPPRSLCSLCPLRPNTLVITPRLPHTSLALSSSHPASAFSRLPFIIFIFLSLSSMTPAFRPPISFLRLSPPPPPLASPHGSRRPIRATIGQPLHQLPRFKSQLGVPSEAIFSPPPPDVSPLAAFTLPSPQCLLPCLPFLPPSSPRSATLVCALPGPFVSFLVHLPPSPPLAW